MTTINQTSTTGTTAKPKWVECLERAEAELLGDRDGHESARAIQWMELARLYKT